MEPSSKYKKGKNSDPSSIVPIFIVDDDLCFLGALGFRLKQNLMYKVYCYTNAEECMKNMQLNPSIIILDYLLNTEKSDAINGLDILKKIKNRKTKTKVIMLSGQKTLEVAISALKSGAYTYLIKDINAIASVLRIVNTLCLDKLKA
ncbi:MAG: response regulator [Bacteroidota bacterium]